MNSSNEADDSIFTIKHKEIIDEDNRVKRDWMDIILDTGATKSVIVEENLIEIQNRLIQNKQIDIIKIDLKANYQL